MAKTLDIIIERDDDGTYIPVNYAQKNGKTYRTTDILTQYSLFTAGGGEKNVNIHHPDEMSKEDVMGKLSEYMDRKIASKKKTNKIAIVAGAAVTIAAFPLTAVIGGVACGLAVGGAGTFLYGATGSGTTKEFGYFKNLVTENGGTVGKGFFKGQMNLEWLAENYSLKENYRLPQDNED